MIKSHLRKLANQPLAVPLRNLINSLHLYPLAMSLFNKSPLYNEDGLISIHNHDFTKDRKFISAYLHGVRANIVDIHWEWRVHVGLWAASHATHLPGDFVECGVNKGFLSSAIMDYVHWNTLNKKFYLFDTFNGIPETLISEEEKKLGRLDENSKYYTECFDIVKKNFSQYKGVIFVKGTIPSTLTKVSIQKICYLSIDMNNYIPEIAAAEFFWPKLVHGAIVLLDDYAYSGFLPQKKAFDIFAKKKGISILSLPTGQGMFIKP
jgi:hypothetical protein